MGPAAERVSRRDVVLSTFVLFNLAVAQPLLDLLGRNAEFFVARGSQPVDVVVLVVVVTLVLPAVLATGVVVLDRHAPRAAAAAHLGVVGLLAAALAVVVVRRSVGVPPDGVTTAVAVAAGASAAAAYRRWPALRALLRLGAPVPLLVAVVFLALTPAAGVVRPAAAQAPAAATISRQAPVVVVVFDELPLVSLLDARGGIDARRLPGFARLAARSTWYRDATTVDQGTPRAIPALLTGRRPRAGQLATAADHPASLFTLLGDRWDVRAVEQLTRLCPASLCPGRVDDGLARRLRSLTADVSVVSGHLLLPPELAGGLPPIGEAWGGFAAAARQDPTAARRAQGRAEFEADADAALAADQRAVFENFLADLQPVRAGARPPLRFLHVMLPHYPWRYLPSGQRYGGVEPPPGLHEGFWGDDGWLAAQSHQRHLLQVGFTDRLLGRLLDRLEAVGLDDDVLLVVTADHGTSFRAGRPRRWVSDYTVGDLAPVPLFVKAPGQRRGAVDDAPVELVDVLPTVGDLLGATPRWDVEGTSAAGGHRPDRTVKVVVGGDGPLEFAAGGAARDAARRRLHRRFGGPHPSLDPFAVAPGGWRGLLGRQVAPLRDDAPAGRAVPLDDPRAFDDVRPEAAWVPAFVAGRVSPPPRRDQPLVLAVAVGGRVRAVTRTHDDGSGPGRFTAVVPPRALGAGRNEVEVLVVGGTPGRPRLHQP